MLITAQEKIAFQLMSEYLLEINPDIHKTCLEVGKPLLEDPKCIPAIFNYVLQNQQYNFNTENANFYLAVIYRIVAPFHLYAKTPKLKAGVRDIIANEFNYKNPEMINYFVDQVLVHYKNPRWAAAVNLLAFEIVENIKEAMTDYS